MQLQIADINRSFQPSIYPSLGKHSEQLVKIKENSLQKMIRISDRVKHQHDNVRSIEERLYDALALCKIKTSSVAMYLHNEWRTSFFLQLDSLMDADNWDDDDSPVNIASFSTLLRMLTFIKPTRRPGLGSTSSGNIIAMWTTESSDHLTIECLPNDRVRWVLSQCIDGNRESIAGDTPLTRLPASLSIYNPKRWFANGNKK